MAFGEFLVPAGHPEEAVHQHVHRGVREAVEVDLEVVVAHRRVLQDEAPHPVHERLDPVRVGVVAERQHVLHAPELPLPHVVHDGVHDLAVRDADHRVVEGADAGGAQPDPFDGPFVAVHEHPVPDLEGSVPDDGQRAHHVGEGVLGGERDGESAEAETRHQGGDRVALALGDEQEGHDHRTYPEDGARQRDEMIVHVGLGLGGHRRQLRTDRLDRPEREPHRDAGQREVQQHVQDLVHQHREPQIGQEPAEDPDGGEPGSREGGGFEFRPRPPGVAGRDPDEESPEEDPEEPLGDPRQRRQDPQADQLPEREPRIGAFDGRREQLQQPPRVPGERFLVEALGGAYAAGGDPPRGILAPAQLEHRQTDREGGEDRLTRIGIEVLRVRGNRAHAHEETPRVEDRFELPGDRLLLLGRDPRLEVEGRRDLVPGNLGLQLAAQERVEGGPRAAEILGDGDRRRGLRARAGGADEDGEGGGDGQGGRSEGMQHGGRGRGAAYAWQDSNLRPTD